MYQNYPLALNRSTTCVNINRRDRILDEFEDIRIDTSNLYNESNVIKEIEGWRSEGWIFIYFLNGNTISMKTWTVMN